MGVLKRGLYEGLRTTWDLGKVIFPVTLIVTILRYTPVLPWLMDAISPLMRWIGLPGEAAIPLVLGNMLNLYASIGAIMSLDLTVKEVFILAVMLSFSHNLLIESTVAAKVGIRMSVVLVVRIGLALLSAVLIHQLWNGGHEQAVYGLVSNTSEDVSGLLSILLNGVEKASAGILQLAMIVIPLMMAIQILKERNVLATFSRWMAPVTRFLGMKENTSTTLASGLLFGLAFGAGVMLQAAREDGVERKDLYLAFIFLVACHAIVEDTLIFIPLGIPVWPLLAIRVLVATLLTIAVATVWNRVEVKGKLQREGATYDN